MAIQTYTIYNNSTLTTATINYITIDTTLTQIQHHLDLTGWLSPFNGYTDFQGASTLQTVTKTYVDDVSPIGKQYVSHTGTNLKLNNNTGIQAGWDVSGDAFTSGQTVASTSGTAWVILSAAPDSPPGVGDIITFSPPENLLILNSISGIGVGWLASGTGYAGQTVLATSSSNTLIMSAPPSTAPSGSIVFTSNEDTMLVIAPSSSKTFAMDYNRVTSAVGTYTSEVAIHATLGTSVIEYVNNFLVISTLPVTDPTSPFYNPVFEAPGRDAPVDCTTDPNASVNCSNPGGSSGDPGKTVVCTAMNEAYGFGSYRNRIWLAYAEKYLTKAHEVGYHAIFLPLVAYGFKQGNGVTNRIVRNILEHIARHRSTDIRAEMRNLKRDNIGRVYRWILEPMCYIVGKLKGY